MNNHPLYENLDTSFVNLSALVRYLRHREFIGRIKIELNNYKADIILSEKNKISVREHDKISGRIAEGEEALQRILIRAREAGGIIHVYQTIGETEMPKRVETKTTQPITNGNSTAHQAEITKASHSEQNGTATKVAEVPKKTEPVKNHPKFPFDLHNSVESKARQTLISAQDWQTLLDLTGELLGTIDRTLAESRLDFKLAFSKARSEISADYPFLHPSNKTFEYLDGKIKMNEQVSAKLFSASINETLRRILDKLGANPKFAEVYRITTQKILALINQRQPLYDEFFITPQLKRVLGV